MKNFPCALNNINKMTLFSLAQEVPQGGSIIEIGACMGGSSAILGKGAPNAFITSYDIFIGNNNEPRPWGGRFGLSSVEDNTKRLADVGVHNVRFVQEDSIRLSEPKQDFDLLIVDGCHDYNWEGEMNPTLFPVGTPDVKKCVHEFLVAYPEFYVSAVAEQEIVLRRS